jgi:phosphoglycerol transferase MdoB-like AlkP superfamily enzyme
MYRDFHVIGNVFSDIDNYNSKGFLYSLIHFNNMNQITAPKGYSQAAVRRAISNYSSIAQINAPVAPNIILILGEAFSEIALAEHFSFENQIDPLKYYREIRKQSIGGNVVVPNYGGGTADSEFDVLTGINTRNFPGIAYSFRLVRDGKPNVNTQLRNAGYKSVAMHPGFGWFYNRRSVYGYLGFAEFHDQTYFERDMKGPYLSESTTYDGFIGLYEQHMANNSDIPLFVKLITIQNHGPYFGNYGVDELVESTLDLDARDILQISNYFYGLADVDEQLKRLTDYLNERPEPTIIVFYSDHFPGFSRDTAMKLITPHPYDDYIGEPFHLYSMPFFIWENESAKHSVGIFERAENIGFHDGETISSFYLGSLMLTLLGLNSDPYYNFLEGLRKSAPIIFAECFINGNGELMNTADNEDVMLFKKWQYHRLFHD